MVSGVSATNILMLTARSKSSTLRKIIFGLEMKVYRYIGVLLLASVVATKGVKHQTNKPTFNLSLRSHSVMVGCFIFFRVFQAWRVMMLSDHRARNIAELE